VSTVTILQLPQAVGGLLGTEQLEAAQPSGVPGGYASVRVTAAQIAALAGQMSSALLPAFTPVSVSASLPTITFCALINASAGNVILTLPSAVGNTALYVLKRIDASGNFVIIQTTGGQTLDSGPTLSLNQNDVAWIKGDSANWWRIV
jgi:hypothetical protein